MRGALSDETFTAEGFEGATFGVARIVRQPIAAVAIPHVATTIAINPADRQRPSREPT